LTLLVPLLESLRFAQKPKKCCGSHRVVAQPPLQHVVAHVQSSRFISIFYKWVDNVSSRLSIIGPK